MAALPARSAGGGLRIGRHDARDARRAAGRRRRNGGSRLRALGMPPAMTSLRVLLLVTLGVLPIQPARAQGTRPWRKAERVGMLARRALSKPQIAPLVRRNCVTFQPPAHARAELRAAGADDAVLAAIDQCLRARLARATPPPSPRPVAPAPARPSAPVPSPVVAVTDTSAHAAPPPPPAPPRPVISERLTQFTGGAALHGTVGSTPPQPLVLEVRDTTGAPFVGQPVTITASSGTVTPSAAESDTSGVVRVRVTLGERAGATTITARVGTLTRTVLVRADPGPPEALVVERGDMPVVGSLTLPPRDTVVLRVVARDRYGNRTALEIGRAHV